jgi:hypothetical protein
MCLHQPRVIKKWSVVGGGGRLGSAKLSSSLRQQHPSQRHGIVVTPLYFLSPSIDLLGRLPAMVGGEGWASRCFCRVRMTMSRELNATTDMWSGWLHHCEQVVFSSRLLSPHKVFICFLHRPDLFGYCQIHPGLVVFVSHLSKLFQFVIALVLFFSKWRMTPSLYIQIALVHSNDYR